MAKSVQPLAILYTLLSFFLLRVDVAFAAPESAWTRLYKEGEHALFIGDYRTAQQAYGSALGLLKESGDHSARLKFTLEKLTQSFLLDNNLKSAELMYGQLRELIHSSDRSSKLEQVFLIDLKELATAYERKWNRYHDPKCLEHSLELLEVATGGEDAKSIEEMVALAHLYINQGQMEKGIDLMKRANSISERTFGKNPSTLTEQLNQLAVGFKKEHKYEQAKQLELNVIRLAKNNSRSLNTGLPVFYLFLSMNAAAQGIEAEAKADLEKSTQMCSQIESTKTRDQSVNQRLALRQYFASLYDAVDSDKREGKLTLAKSELNHILLVEQLLLPDPFEQYGAISRLADVLETEHKYREAEKYLTRAVAMGKLPNSFVKNELPELYMRLGIAEYAQNKAEAANTAFSEAIKIVTTIEKGTDGFRPTLILLRWGMACKDAQDFSLALPKFNEVLVKAREMPAEKRGTLIADVLESLVDVEIYCGRGNQPRAQTLHQQSLAEIQAQRSIKSQVGPDFYHRM